MNVTSASADSPTVAKPTAPAPLRTWTDNTGKLKVHARFIKLENGKVIVEREGGNRSTVPLERLSEDDQEYVREQTENAQPKEP